MRKSDSRDGAGIAAKAVSVRVTGTRALTRVAVAALLLTGGGAVPASASSGAAAFNCTGRNPQHILARYGHSADGAEYPVPLRCGNRRWGYKHFAHRWSNSFESHLERTLNDPTVQQRGGSTRVVCRRVNASPERQWFKVVHTTDPGDRNLGIITAVWEGPSGTCL
ncbi:hypothetical protein [Sinosporangium siamense]|uniref:Uncharacterized protein n=1 Tax=Sinosporangium siamense TaxID=1367973 RepID=A0A919V769_9ACTN|nr:hypothetical protein [Sinosporangium siamense]GII92776.1 hypothetical protein Ssi02_30070 [Sinosporangium siamense]